VRNHGLRSFNTSPVGYVVKVGDLVVSARGHWHDPRLVVAAHETAKNLIGVFWPNGEIRYVHYKHLEVISASR